MKFSNVLALSIFSLFTLNVGAEPAKSSDWMFESENSSVSFVTIKKGNIAESHIFTDISGTINSETATIIIKPNSVDTLVPIRNERMREFLFETKIYPTIQITANVNNILNNLTLGTSQSVSIPATLSMHGVTKSLSLDVRLSALNESQLIVSSTKSVLIRAADYNMLDGITKLSSLVNNLPIAESIPVNFSLSFTKQ